MGDDLRPRLPPAADRLTDTVGEVHQFNLHKGMGMGIDTTAAGKLIAEQMEAIEKDYEDRDDCKVGAVVAIVEVVGDDGAEFRVRNNLGNLPMTLGVMRLAENQMILASLQGNQEG